MGIFRREAVRMGHGAGAACIFIIVATAAIAAPEQTDLSAQQQLRQQERERALRERQEAMPDARLPASSTPSTHQTYPEQESPCFVITSIELTGDAAARFEFALADVKSIKKEP